MVLSYISSQYNKLHEIWQLVLGNAFSNIIQFLNHIEIQICKCRCFNTKETIWSELVLLFSHRLYIEMISYFICFISNRILQTIFEELIMLIVSLFVMCKIIIFVLKSILKSYVRYICNQKPFRLFFRRVLPHLCPSKRSKYTYLTTLWRGDRIYYHIQYKS